MKKIALLTVLLVSCSNDKPFWRTKSEAQKRAFDYAKANCECLNEQLEYGAFVGNTFQYVCTHSTNVVIINNVYSSDELKFICYKNEGEQ